MTEQSHDLGAWSKVCFCALQKPCSFHCYSSGGGLEMSHYNGRDVCRELLILDSLSSG